MKLNEVYKILKETPEMKRLDGETDDGIKFTAYKIIDKVRIDIDAK